MSKAEEKAKLAYPDNPYYGGRNAQRLFAEGYEQAEKDLVLTWEDIRTIAFFWINSLTPYGEDGRLKAEEVLSRFNKQRKHGKISNSKCS